ncbi:MAG: hypothetical protein ABII82_13560 [Verrucomicrobiota bacterium]
MIDVVRFVPKGQSRLMGVLGWLLRLLTRRDFEDYRTTLRLPFGPPTIYHPSSVADPLAPKHAGIVAHELVHVGQQDGARGLVSSALLYFLVPLPVGLSGRWLIERDAYLLDIQGGRMDVEQAVGALWRGYFFPWPRGWMREWFLARLAGQAPTTGQGWGEST